MSASRDKSQKIGFVFSNLYQLYRKGKDAATAAEIPNGAEVLLDVHAQGPVSIPRPSHPGGSGLVIKTGDLKHQSQVEPHNPTEFLALRAGVAEAMKLQSQRASVAGKRVPRPPVLPASTAVVTLRENLKALNDLHSRLRFMLQELEDLVKE